MTTNGLQGLLLFYEELAEWLMPYRSLLRALGFMALGGMIESIWQGAGLHQLFYFIGVTWTFGLTVLCRLYASETSEPNWIRRSSDIIQSSMAFFTTAWYVILIIVSIAIIVKLSLVANGM
ncbi:MAG: hypothetical protein KDI30_06105 [Pseudomonadales bacterium]|nr:hypothetical protein [Pseudomonadales bacterium]